LRQQIGEHGSHRRNRHNHEEWNVARGQQSSVSPHQQQHPFRIAARLKTPERGAGAQQKHGFEEDRNRVMEAEGEELRDVQRIIGIAQVRNNVLMQMVRIRVDQAGRQTRKGASEVTHRPGARRPAGFPV